MNPVVEVILFSNNEDISNTLMTTQASLEETLAAQQNVARLSTPLLLIW
jgi:hypothetical protein